ncbi:MAG: hypothetical protein AB7F89_17930 [Pirellulaceae bacterium]
MSRGLTLTWLLLICAGCSTHAQQLRDARERFFQGDLAGTSATLEKVGGRWHRDGDCLQLDRAMVSLVSGHAQEAEQSLREVRDRFDHLEQQDLAESAWAMFTDDQRRAYAGEDYEKVLIRAFLALSNLMHDGGDAVAYSLQVEEKQQEIIQKGVPGEQENPKLAYKQVALGPYLSGMLREATHGQYDEAARSFTKVVSWEPGFRPGPVDLARAQVGRHSEPGHGVVYVFALVGRGPYKEETIEEPTSGALLIADRVLSALGKYQLPPTIAPIKVPQVVIPVSEVDGVLVHVNQQPVGATQTITDVCQLAAQQHQAVFSHLVARAVVRRVVKKAVAYGVQDTLAADNGLVNLGVLAAGVVWEFTESADTRCWGLLPAQIQVLRAELPRGTHELELRPARRGSQAGPAHRCSVPVVDGRNTYVLACFPNRNLVGQLQVSSGP